MTCMALFLCDADNVDVNVTPDKRQIYVQEEKLLLATIKVNIVNWAGIFKNT